jgi:hypothetical protein
MSRVDLIESYMERNLPDPNDNYPIDPLDELDQEDGYQWEDPDTDEDWDDWDSYEENDWSLD